MYQGTTPALMFQIPGWDLTGKTVYVSFKDRDGVLTKSGSSVIIAYDDEEDISTVVCRLTQQETLAFEKGNITVQIRFIDQNNIAWATEKKKLSVDSVIYPEVITYLEG